MTTLEKLLRDAQQLVGKMKQNDAVAENIAEHYQYLSGKIEGMKKYQEVSMVPTQKNAVNQNLNLLLLPENQHIRDLENENKELRSFLDEHQTALELIMSKYRLHINKHLNSQTITLTTEDCSAKFEALENRINQINDMKNMMWKVLECDEPGLSSSCDELIQLEKEHSTLKQLLHISKSFGNNCIFTDEALNSSYELLKPSTCFEEDQITSFICQNPSDE